MLTTSKITKKFGTILALDEVSFKIPEKGVVGLLGPNGAGKTTLMRILSGFLTANSGNIKWQEKIVDPKSIQNKKRIGYLPEGNPLYGNMTAFDYLVLISQLKQVKNIDEDVTDVIRKCGLENVVGQKIETLSKGYKQRVGLAAAILGNPKILILDEPTSGLDPNQIIEIRQLIKTLAKNRLVLLSTHILPEAKEVCARLLIINRGKIVLDDETKKIKNLEKKFVELTS